MKSTRVSFLMIVVLALMPACGGHGHSQDRTDQAQPDSGDERPTVAVTHWTDRSELFMEYPVFVAGASGRAAVHVTDLADFSPLSTGQAVVHLRSEDGRELAFQGGPSRPGIFGIDLEVSRPGVYEMTLRVDAPELQDLHELGQITVHPPEETLATGNSGRSSSEPRRSNCAACAQASRCRRSLPRAPAETRC